MQCHASDLRVEIAHDWLTLTDAALPSDEADFDAFVHTAVDDWRVLPVSTQVRRLLEWAEKITLTPATCTKDDADNLRSVGWTDEAIHDAAQVISYFNYINRIADALGVESETHIARWGQWKPHRVE